MRRFLPAMIMLITLGLAPASAELYRWTDKAGKTHVTDNPDNIPPAYRSRVTVSEPPALPAPPALEVPQASPLQPEQESQTEPPSLPQVPPQDPPQVPPQDPPQVPPKPAVAPRNGSVLESTLAGLEEQMRAARQERQTYFERLRAERGVHTTPEFVRQRRQITELRRGLFAVERQIDTLQAAVVEAQRQRQTTPDSAALQSASVVIDHNGHDEAYWQRRVAGARERLQQAQAQRRTLLDQRAPQTDGETRDAERLGREFLQQVATLEQLASTIEAAEGELRGLHNAARDAGAPAAWLE